MKEAYIVMLLPPVSHITNPHLRKIHDLVPWNVKKRKLHLSYINIYEFILYFSCLYVGRHSNHFRTKESKVHCWVVMFFFEQLKYGDVIIWNLFFSSSSCVPSPLPPSPPPYHALWQEVTIHSTNVDSTYENICTAQDLNK